MRSYELASYSTGPVDSGKSGITESLVKKEVCILCIHKLTVINHNRHHPPVYEINIGCGQ